MKQALTIERMTEQDQQISETIEREQVRLRNFIRRRVDDESDADDILQDVFYELVEAYRLMQPIEQVGAWLFRVARNRIIDRFRKRKTKPETLQEEVAVALIAVPCSTTSRSMDVMMRAVFTPITSLTSAKSSSSTRPS